MTRTPPVSVGVVSHGRPDALARCLTALTQLDYPAFEIIVVADKPGLNRTDQMPALFRRIKRARFDSANISHARNLGIAQAAGEIVAFIDDDAVAEPLWLRHLAAPFEDDRVQSAGGTVLGRNGFSVQWGPRTIHPSGRSEPIEVPGDKPALFTGRPGLGIKTEGTNMAFRRSVLAAMGGFDPVFRFYLDESDVNLRLAAEGQAAALVPLARVHHGFLPSARRRADRVPRDLHQVGASLAAFLRKHAPPEAHAGAIAAERGARWRALVDHMVAGRIEPRDVGRILATFDTGLAEGRDRPLDPLPRLPEPVADFLPFPPGDVPRGGVRVLPGRIWHRQRRMQEAAALAAEGHVATVLILSPSARPHTATYRPEGYWLHRGGRFGRSLRSDPAVRYWRFGKRVKRETALFSASRGTPLIAGRDRAQ